MDRVAERRESIIITKRGQPVACLTPVKQPAQPALFGYLAGKARIKGDIVGPIGEDWEAAP
ncbi:MAG: type II toxin-antitoxin system Phd/YefM family antitoxin [Kiritimatiellia bacterium]